MIVSKLLTRIAIIGDNLGTFADVISGRSPVTSDFLLNLTLNVKCQVKGNSCVSCSGRLVIVLDHFGTRVYLIWDEIQYHFLGP